jgi:hypothetical protein
MEAAMAESPKATTRGKPFWVCREMDMIAVTIVRTTRKVTQSLLCDTFTLYPDSSCSNRPHHTCSQCTNLSIFLQFIARGYTLKCTMYSSIDRIPG